MTETPAGNTEVPQQAMFAKMLDTAKSVILQPAAFFRGMAKTGGFVEPLLFLVVVAVLTAVVQAVLGLVHLIPFWSVRMALMALVMTPIAAAVFGFVGAAILFLIWKLMGSQESYEASYRCAAYAGAIAPITALLQPIPYAGPLIAIAWGLWLIVIASVEVHKIKAKTAWIVFGIIAALFALASLSARRAASRLSGSMSEFQRQYGPEPGKELTPEQAGRAAAAFMKAMQESAEKDAKESGKKADEDSQ